MWEGSVEISNNNFELFFVQTKIKPPSSSFKTICFKNKENMTVKRDDFWALERDLRVASSI